MLGRKILQGRDWRSVWEKGFAVADKVSGKDSRRRQPLYKEAKLGAGGPQVDLSGQRAQVEKAGAKALRLRVAG